MKLPRDISASELIKILSKYGYQVSRQRGSHIRLTRITDKAVHNITIPNHNPIKIGTLSGILNDICSHLNISKEELLS
ncbi:type II toxin-antitoxin system HicA family toxin [Rubrolithibacter danxiaensis]|uniref:type II toxin-antitoxin system HicA family toxin n=1 Tax=Rubrolithibacter danxiaensis TaxID=3390805 RepID=UPI003BF778D6